MACADLCDSDSFFENEIESDAEQTLIRQTLMLADFLNGLMIFGHADKSGEREILMMASVKARAPASYRDSSSVGPRWLPAAIQSGPRLVGRCGVGRSLRIGLGFLSRFARGGSQRALPALAGIAHQGCTRGPVEYVPGQPFGSGGLFLKILRGHRCTSSAQAEANACLPSICPSGSGLCEGGHSGRLYISACGGCGLSSQASAT
jgi:hypothetical protein